MKTKSKVKLQGNPPKNVPHIKELTAITKKLTQFCRDNSIDLFLATEIRNKSKAYGINAIQGGREHMSRIVVQNLEREPILKWQVMRRIIGRPSHAVMQIKTYKSMEDFKKRSKGKKK